MTWLLEQAPGATPFDRVLGLRPELRDLLGDYVGLVWSEHLVDEVVLELCRLRIAQLHGSPGELALRYEPAMAAGLTEDKVAALPQYYASELFTPHECACLTYAEKYVIDVHSLTDDDAEAVKRQMTDEQFVAFTVALGLLDGLGRMRLVLGVEPPDGAAPATPRLVEAPAPGQPLC